MSRYAIVIGIAEYQRPLAPLRNTTTDAEEVAKILENYGNFEVTRIPRHWNEERSCYEMTSSPLSSQELGEELKTFLRDKADKSEALIYFTGHGFTLADNLGQQKGYLATSDCTVEKENLRPVDQRRGTSLDSLNDLIRKSNLSSLVLLLDCCHSGSFLERNLVEQTLTAFSSQKDYCLITACRGFEAAYGGETHSIFTGALLRGLSAENARRDGLISGDRLFDFISRELRGSGQESIHMGWGRAITLVTYPLKEKVPVSDEFKRENPFVGLQAFEFEQAAYFYGRERAIRELLARLNNSRFLAIIGPSGCGKSSLVKAGLLPQLQQDRIPGSSQWPVERLTPGSEPLDALTEILNRHNRPDRPLVLFIDQFEELFTLCKDEEKRWNFIHLMADEATNPERQTRVIVAIRGDFLESCAPYPDAASLINQTCPTTYIVEPLTQGGLEEAIHKPAEQQGVAFEPGLVSQIAEDVVDRPGALPLLQYALMKLWQACIEDKPAPQPLLTWQGYEEIGRVQGALDRRATTLYRSLKPADQSFVRRLFMELVELGEGQEATRHRADWNRIAAQADSPEQLQRVKELFSSPQQRLIVTDEKTVEVTHEALFSEWQLLKGWIAENRENIRQSRSLAQSCLEWDRDFQQSEDALLSGARLAVIEEWVKQAQPRLTDEEKDYLQRSIGKRDLELKAQLSRERQLRQLAEERQQEAEARAKVQRQRTQITIGSAIALLALSIVVIGLRSRVQQQTALATWAITETVPASFDEYNQQKALISGLRSLHAFKRFDGYPPEALNRIRNIFNSIQEQNQWIAHESSIQAVSVRPYSETLLNPEIKIASADRNGTIKLWNAGGDSIPGFPKQKGRIWDLKFSPTGNKFATAGEMGIWLWSVEPNIDGINLYNKDSYSLDFSPDGNQLVTSTADGLIKVWDLSGKDKQKIYDSVDANNLDTKIGIYSVNFHPKNRNLVAYVHILKDYKSLVKILNIQNNQSYVIGMYDNLVHQIRFSSDGSILATSSNGMIRLWDIKTLETLRLFAEFNIGRLQIYDIAFSDNDQFLVSGGADTEIRVWDIKLIQAIKEKYQEVQKPINITIGRQETVGITRQETVEIRIGKNEVKDQTLLRTTIRGHTSDVNTVSFIEIANQVEKANDQNLLIISGSDDQTLRIWDWNNSNPLNDNADLDEVIQYGCSLLEKSGSSGDLSAQENCNL